jgi:hypothetical protein
MPIDSHLPQADPFSLVPTFKEVLRKIGTTTQTYASSIYQSIVGTIDRFVDATKLK